MTILAYRVDDLTGQAEPEYICVSCFDDGLADDGDWYDGMRLVPITNPSELPAGPSGLGRECDSPFCEDRLPVAR